MSDPVILALMLHLMSGRQSVFSTPGLIDLIGAIIAGNVMGRVIGNYLPVPLISATIRVIAILAAARLAL